MGKRSFALLAILLAVTVSGCQATPTKAIVKEKNLEKMIEEATKTLPPPSAGATLATADAQESATPGPHANALAARMAAPETWQKELEDAKGKVKIHVNALVLVPDVQGVAVQRVEQAQITQQQVDALLQRLMKGDLFAANDYKPSKSEIQNQILQVQAALAKSGRDLAAAAPTDRGTYRLQALLEKLQQDLKTAAETSTKTPSFGKLEKTGQGQLLGEELYALSQPSDNEYQSIRVCNFDDGTAFLNYSSEWNAFSRKTAAFATREAIEAALSSGLTSLMTIEELDAIPDIAVTGEEAKMTADEIVAALGLDDHLCISADKMYGGSSDKTADQSAYVNPRRCVWFLRYARSVNGVPVTYTAYDCTSMEQDNQSAHSYEDMTFAIDDSGVVYFDWVSPYNITGTVTENSNVLSFQETMNIFNIMAPVVNAWDGFSEGNPNLTGVEITIDRIQFGLTRITEQNKRNSGLLAPCWDFIGTITYIMEQDGQTRRMDDGPIPLLTVNAIDGTIINRSLGY